MMKGWIRELRGERVWFSFLFDTSCVFTSKYIYIVNYGSMRFLPHHVL